jgi:hypothetical protein
MAFCVTVASSAALAFAEGEAAAPAPVDMIVMCDGDVATGYIRDITPDGTLMLATTFSAKPTEIALSRITNITLNTKDPDLARRIRRDWIFYLTDGSRITGRLDTWSDKFVTVRIDYGTAIKIPRAALERVSPNGNDFFGPPPEGDKPVLYLVANGQKITGNLKEVSTNKIVIEGRPDQEFRITDLQGISLPVPKAPPQKAPVRDHIGWYAILDMPNADRLSGQIDKLVNGKLYLITQYCGMIEIERNSVARIAFSSGLHLSFGNTLLVDLGRAMVIELDPQGKEVWTYRHEGVSEARLLPDGKVLVTAPMIGMVFEVNKNGTITWIRNGLANPVSAARLPDGSIVISETGKFRLVVFDRQGNQIRTLGNVQATWVDATPEGTILLTDPSGVRELDLDGNEIWSTQRLNTHLINPTCARMLPGGQIAVLEAGAGKIHIFQKPATLVRSIDVGTYQGVFKVLSNGNILLVLHNSGDNLQYPIMKEIDPVQGKTVREVRVQSTGFSRISSLDRN